MCIIEDMEYSLTAREVAQAVQLTTERVRQLARDHIIEGRQAGTLWLFPASAIEAIKGRPEKRGGDRRRKI